MPRYGVSKATKPMIRWGVGGKAAAVFEGSVAASAARRPPMEWPRRMTLAGGCVASLASEVKNDGSMTFARIFITHHPRKLRAAEEIGLTLL
jgi:hypothetical protein